MIKRIWLLRGGEDGRRGGGAGGDVGERGHAETDRAAAVGYLVHMGELGARTGEADLEAVGLTEPAVLFGLGDPRG
jgi:hypothetical protein